jgi:phage terminase large subunit
VLADKGYVYGKHWAPHDIQVRELGSGRSRIETAQALGIRFETVPNVPLEDGVHAARMFLPRMWFDQNKCAAWLEALTNYRWAENKQLGELKSTPVHDWSSHAADMTRYGALCTKERLEAKKINLARQFGGEGAWMG